VANTLLQALEGPQEMMRAIRPLPDIVAAVTKRIAALGSSPPPRAPVQVDYLRLLEHARPRKAKAAEPFD
jgi:hypothetical protein